MHPLSTYADIPWKPFDVVFSFPLFCSVCLDKITDMKFREPLGSLTEKISVQTFALLNQSIRRLRISASLDLGDRNVTRLEGEVYKGTRVHDQRID